MIRCIAYGLTISLLSISCVSKKKYALLQSEITSANDDMLKCSESLSQYMNQLEACKNERDLLKGELKTNVATLQLKQEQIDDLRLQVNDARTQRDKQLNQVGDLTVLTKEANENVKQTLDQLERKDKYINLLQAAKTQADSLNLALAINLKDVLKEGIEDKDIDIKVDKTVVFVNLSDKMLFQSGSYRLSPRANEVLEKIARIVASRPDLEVMVEGYTDNVPMRSSCIEDNWDLSVKRSASVVRALQSKYNINPNKLIAAGRGEYNTLASNDTAEGKAINRRTRIILLPKLDQFYDLLNPNNVPD